jgi:hypothetical protein
MPDVIKEEIKPIGLAFTDINNLVKIPMIDDGSCYFHSVLRAFNTDYMKTTAVFERINLARSFRNNLAVRLSEIDPITSQEYYDGLNNGSLADISKGVKEYSKDYLRKELLSSGPVDNIYQELISNAINKDIYIIDMETMDMYNTGSSYMLYYKGRNSIVIAYLQGRFETIGLKRSDGTINTVFTPEHPFIQACKERLISAFKIDKKNDYMYSKGLSPRITALRGISPRR